MANPPARKAPRGSLDRMSLRYALACAIATIVVVVTVLGRLPVLFAGAYAAMSLVSLLLYRIDKTRAQQGEWRISEAMLHGADLLGGIAGGLVAQESIRHKTAKHDFAVVTYAIAGLHILLLLGIAANIITLENVADFFVELEANYQRNR